MKRENKQDRILGIDPCPRGFGFVVLDSPTFLNDWGVARVTGRATSAYIVRIVAMIERHEPDVIAVPRPADFRRKSFLRRLIAALVRCTTKRPIVVRIVSRVCINAAFHKRAKTKYERATHLTHHFPELKPFLPPPRKIWNSEDLRMNIFDALTLIFATLEETKPASNSAESSIY